MANHQVLTLQIWGSWSSSVASEAIVRYIPPSSEKQRRWADLFTSVYLESPWVLN